MVFFQSFKPINHKKVGWDCLKKSFVRCFGIFAFKTAQQKMLWFKFYLVSNASNKSLISTFTSLSHVIITIWNNTAILHTNTVNKIKYLSMIIFKFVS